MKYFSKFALSSLLLATCSAFAVTPQDGWYAGLMGGLSFSPSLSGRIPNTGPLNNLVVGFVDAGTPLVNPLPINPATPNPLLNSGFITGSISHGVGGDGGGQIGYRICNFRFEGQLLINYAPISSVSAGGISLKRHVTPLIPVRISGNTTLIAGLFNAFYDFYDEENDPTWVPYVGLGIGYSHIQNSLSFNVPYLFRTPLSISAKNNKNSPVGQLILGISYYSSDNLSIGLDYRYVTTGTLSNNNNNQIIGANAVIFNTRLKANTLNLNFNYWFEDI